VIESLFTKSDLLNVAEAIKDREGVTLLENPAVLINS
jgi:hypothetical protein